jgi:hypothetical protein
MMNHLLMPKARKSAVLTCIAERVRRMAALLARSSGQDVIRLGRGLAAGRLIVSQARALPELLGVKIDPRYGNAGTIIGATASVIIACSILVTPSNAEWFRGRAAFLSALVRCEGHLNDWTSQSTDCDAAAVLECECRAVARAIRATEVAILIATERGLDAMASVRLQLGAAQKAAFPPTQISLQMQPAILAAIERRELIFEDACPMVEDQPPPLSAPDGVIPLAELGRFDVGNSGSSSSSGSSSGVLLSSASSEMYETGSGSLETEQLDQGLSSFVFL